MLIDLTRKVIAGDWQRNPWFIVPHLKTMKYEEVSLFRVQVDWGMSKNRLDLSEVIDQPSEIEVRRIND